MKPGSQYRYDTSDNSSSKGSETSFWDNFWYALTHPFSTFGGAVKAAGSGYGSASNQWSAKELSDYAYSGHVPDRILNSGVTVNTNISQDPVVNDNGTTSVPVGSSGENTVNDNGTASTNSGQTVQDTMDHFLDRYIDLFNQQRDYENALAQQNTADARQWEEYMSSTSHQREVADLEAAGLNKWLSANNGGASTPVVSAASTSRVGASDSVNSAVSMASVMASIMENQQNNMYGIIGKLISKIL